MRILHVIGSLSPADGGPPEALRQLVAAQGEAGDLVEVVCLDAHDAAFLQGLPCPVQALGPGWLGVYALSPRLRGWLNSNAARFDALLMHGIWTYPGIAVRRAAKRASRPYGVFPHGALDPWFNRAYPLKRIKKQLYWPLQHPVLRDARAVFFTTETERDLAATSFRPGNWNGVVVPFGINDPNPDPTSSTWQLEAFHRALPQLRNRRYLLFLGRLHEKKGCDLLIQAFAAVAPEAADLDLVMAGPGQAGLQPELEGLARQAGIAARVHWPGILQGDAKWGALQGAEALVLPSHQENFGLAVVESLAAGRPALISNQVNIWPQVAADGAGLVEDDTLEGTTRLLRRWLHLPATERDRMAASARQCFLDRYAMSRAVDVIRQALASPSSATLTLHGGAH